MGKKIFFGFLFASTLILLLGFCISGWYSRYQADDYCYDAEFIQHGFWNGQIDSYLNLMPYSSNRYSLTLFSGIVWAFGGVMVAPILPGFVLLGWGGLLFYAVKQGFKVTGISLHILSVSFIATTMVFYTLLLAPNRYQNLFWRSGMLPYFFPLLISTLLLGRFLSYVNKKQIGIVGIAELLLIAWIAAGFSETMLALQVGFWIIVLIYALAKRVTTAWISACVILLGTVIGFLFFILNPTNALRQSHFPPPPSLWSVTLDSLQYAGSFIIDSVRSAPLPFSALILSGILFGWLENPLKEFRWRSLLITPIVVGVAINMLISCIMAPTVWAMSSFPDPRSLLAGTFLICLFCFLIGTIIASAGNLVIHQHNSPQWKLAMIILLALMLGGYNLHFLPTQFKEIEVYRKRVHVWDARNASILKDRAEGNLHPLVPGIDSIAGIIELQPNENFWVNRCAAIYYDVEDIRTKE